MSIGYDYNNHSYLFISPIMSYNKTKIAVYDPEKGYNKAAKIYKTFHE
jgi:hypothetical protein